MSTPHSAAATAATYAASSSAIVFGLSANELAAISGVCIAALTFALNWYYKREHLKLARERIERASAEQQECDDDSA